MEKNVGVYGRKSGRSSSDQLAYWADTYSKEFKKKHPHPPVVFYEINLEKLGNKMTLIWCMASTQKHWYDGTGTRLEKKGNIINARMPVKIGEKGGMTFYPHKLRCCQDMGLWGNLVSRFSNHMQKSVCLFISDPSGADWC
jgi:hypothetical protein